MNEVHPGFSSALPDSVTEVGGTTEPEEIRLVLDLIASSNDFPDNIRRLAWRALCEIRRLTRVH